MKRNTLTTAVLAGLTGMAGMVSVSNAVNVNPDGLGQVLLYPYYSARGGNDTLISIVNTTNQAKAVKVRFIEALNSREVLDFNLYLSPYDVWTSAVTADGDGAKMITSDTSCTVPYFQGGVPGDVGEQEFLTFQYTAAGRNDGGPQGRERTASGYIEMIEMGTLRDGSPGFDAVKHTSAGVPPLSGAGNTRCGLVVERWLPDSNLGVWESDDPFIDMYTEDGGQERIPASGGLFGSATIMNAAEGTMLSYNATAIDGFWIGAATHTDPGDLLPGLSSGSGDTAFVFNNGQLETLDYSLADDGLEGILAINAVLTVDALMNEYVIESDVNANTEWVLTFPTKRFHTDAAPGGFLAAGDAAIAPFTATWTVDAAGIADPSCEEQSFRFWDREEQEPEDRPGEIIVSPPPPPGETPTFELCREANVVRFANDGSLPEYTEILKEALRDDPYEDLGYVNFGIPEAFQSGWVRFDFGDYESLGDAGGQTVIGLPVIGFQATTFNWGDMPTQDGGTVLANYGAAFNHRGSRSFGFEAD